MISKAVIPIAGLGTRLFPASHACKKELFPVVGPDGIARPLLHYQLMDVLSAGIEHVCIIVRPGEERLVIDYLEGPGQAYVQRLRDNRALMQEVHNMRSALDHITFAMQEEQEGYGHAVFQSRAFAAGEPVLLCLGDHLFRCPSESCHARLMQAFEACGGRSVSAVNRICADQLAGYGTIAGRRRPNTPELIDVTLIVEKPSPKMAREHLRVDGLAADEFLGWFGMHALAPSIYDVLEEMIREDIRQRGEVQLTDAQELLRQREGYCALEIREGKRFDFGLPAEYAANMVEFGRAA